MAALTYLHNTINSVLHGLDHHTDNSRLTDRWRGLLTVELSLVVRLNKDLHTEREQSGLPRQMKGDPLPTGLSSVELLRLWQKGEQKGAIARVELGRKRKHNYDFGILHFFATFLVVYKCKHLQSLFLFIGQYSSW